MRKLIFVLLILALLLLVASFFTNISGYFTGSKGLFTSVPSSNLGVVYVKDAQAFKNKIEQTAFKNNLDKIELSNKLQSLMQDIADITDEENPNIKSIPICASLHLISPQKYDYLLHIKASNISFLRFGQFKKQLEEKGAQIDVHQFSGVSIYKVNKNKNELYFAQSGQNILISRHATLIEEAINQRSEKSSDIASWLLSGSYHKDDFAVYLNLENAGLLNTVFTQSGKKSWFNQLNNAGEAVYAHFNLLENRIKFAGQIEMSNEHLDFQDHLQNAGTLNAEKIKRLLPANTALATFQKWERNPNISNLEFEVLEKHVLPWFDKEWAYIVPEFQQKSMGSCLILSSSDPLRANNLISLLASNSGVNKEIREYRGFDLKELKNTDIPTIFLGEYLAEDYKNCLFTVIENNLVIGSDERSLKALLDQFINKQSLNRESAFTEFVSHYASGTNVCIQARHLQQLLLLNPSENFSQSLQKYGGDYKVFSPLFANIQTDGEFTGDIFYNAVSGVESAVAWSVVLDAPPATQPYVVKHKGQSEILVQDKDNALYLLSGDGQKLWKKQLASSLLSKVYPIDFYNDGQTQYLFNTQKNIYIIDHQGVPLDNFPIRLSSTANTGLLLANFRGEQYIYIPCKNERIYGYELNGKPLKAWSPMDGLGLVNTPLKILEQNKNQFIIAANSNGTLSFISPQGELEFAAALESPIIGDLYVEEREGFKVIVASCKNGKTYTVNQEGSYWSKNYMPLNENSMFHSANIQGSESRELIFSSSNKVGVFNTIEKLYDYELSCTPSQIFTNTIPNESVRRLGIFCEDAQQIYLLNNNEKVSEGFPIDASTPFVVDDLFNTGEQVLISGGTQNNIFAYRIK